MFISLQYTNMITALFSRLYCVADEYFPCILTVFFWLISYFSCQNIFFQLLNYENFKAAENLNNFTVNIDSQLANIVLTLSHFCPSIHFSIHPLTILNFETF